MILACGDALIDFVAREENGRAIFEPFPGGSVLNLAIALGRLGRDVAFVGGISSDMFGDTLVAHLRASHVDTRFVDRLESGTTLAFAKLTDGHSEYAFFDENSAMRNWRMRPERFTGAAPDAVHIGSIALNDPVAFKQCRLFAEAFRATSVVSLDPNCRPSLIGDAHAYRERIFELFGLTDILKLSDEDLAFLAPGVSVEAFVKDRLNEGVKLVVLTRGAHGVRLQTARNRVEVGAQTCVLKDTIGAGDSFHGALLSALEEKGLLRKTALEALSVHDLERIGTFAARAAAMTCSRDGANPPWAEELEVCRAL